MSLPVQTLKRRLKLSRSDKDKRSRYLEKFFGFLLRIGIVISLGTTLAVMLMLGKESFAFFQYVPFIDFISGVQWEPLIEPRTYGVLPLVVGTLMIAFGSLTIAVPLGLSAAFYLSEFASRRTREILKPALEVLAGIPTVVYGYFALLTITPALKSVFPEIPIFNALSACLVVGIMVLPMIASLCADAFQALPRSLKEGAYALGARADEVSLGILLPAASGRVLAAILLATSRAVGETMAVTLAAGATPSMDFNFLESVPRISRRSISTTLKFISDSNLNASLKFLTEEGNSSPYAPNFFK